VSNGRQACRGLACRQRPDLGLWSASIVMFCVSQSSTSARCQPTGFPQCVRCFGNRPRTASPRSSQRGRRVRREISLALSSARRSGSGSLTHRGRRRSCDVRMIVGAAGEPSFVDRVSMFLPHLHNVMGSRMRRRDANSSARIQGRDVPNAARLSDAIMDRSRFSGEVPEKLFHSRSRTRSEKCRELLVVGSALRGRSLPQIR
jgi:hypothetical protein